MIITRTPFRMSFFGGGTDFPARYTENGGAVLSTTIDKYCQGRNAGALGGKILGTGRGGFILFYVRPDDREKIRTALSHLLHVPFRFDTLGTQLIYYAEE